MPANATQVAQLTVPFCPGRCAAEIVKRVASEGAEVMIATHNQESIERAVALMAQLGLPPSSSVYFGQLLGMADHLTFTLGAHGYGVSAANLELLRRGV